LPLCRGVDGESGRRTGVNGSFAHSTQAKLPVPQQMTDARATMVTASICTKARTQE
jgi:hypothetical protein